jgi:hypothetical protein
LAIDVRPESDVKNDIEFLYQYRDSLEQHQPPVWQEARANDMAGDRRGVDDQDLNVSDGGDDGEIEIHVSRGARGEPAKAGADREAVV